MDETGMLCPIPARFSKEHRLSRAYDQIRVMNELRYLSCALFYPWSVMYSSSISKLLSFLSFMASRSFAMVSNQYLYPMDAASLSIFSPAADGFNNGNLIGSSELGVTADGINSQPGKQALAPSSVSGGISASLMQTSEGESHECITHTNQFANNRRRVRRGELCRSNLWLTPDISKKDSNLPTAPADRQENSDRQRGNIEEASPSNDKKPSSGQEPKPGQSAEKKDEPNTELCIDDGSKYAVCGPYLWAEQFGPPYRRRWNLEGCNPCTWILHSVRSTYPRIPNR